MIYLANFNININAYFYLLAVVCYNIIHCIVLNFAVIICCYSRAQVYKWPFSLFYQSLQPLPPPPTYSDPRLFGFT